MFVMTLAEILKSQGLNDDQIQAITGEMKKNKIFTASEENLDIRYSKLKGDHDTLTAQHKEVTALLEQAKAGTKDNEALQGKFADAEQKIARLQKERDEARLDAAMDRALMKAGAKASDFDYLKFQWRKKGEISLDDNGEVKGVEDAVAAMKTQFPGQFATAKGVKVEENPLPSGNNNNSGVTQEQFDRMGYQSRLKLKQEQPEVYAQMTGKTTN
jgi:hypothetical protein